MKPKKIKNRAQLNKYIQELEASRETRSNDLLATSDATREKAGNIQHYMYLAQVGLGLFRGLTNYHRSPKTRIRNAVISIGVLLLSNYVRKLLVKQPKSDEPS